MKSCKNCKDRHVCVSVCPSVERLLPKDDTGKDSHREVNLDTEVFLSVVENNSFSEWYCYEAASNKIAIDLSMLSPKERAAFRLLASGLTGRAAARRLKIKLSSFQKRINTGRARLSACQFSHLVEEKNTAAQHSGSGGGR